MQSLSPSVLRRSHKSALKNKAVTLKDGAVLKQEVEDLETIAEVASEEISFYECRGELAHQYVTEICSTEWFSLKCEMRWEPNDTDSPVHS